MTCQPIEGTDVRKGDRVRVTQTAMNGDEIIATFIVTEVSPDAIHGGSLGSWHTNAPHELRKWELLDRPKPKLKLGSLWEIPGADTDTIYAASDNVHRPFVQLRGNNVGVALLADFNQDVITRLVAYEESA